MTLHVIVGAGPIGSSTALLLAARGERVRVLTRSGQGPSAENIENTAVDALDTERLTRLAEGAAVLYNCANPPYHRWPEQWPPLAESLLTAAERTGAGLVTMSNLYGHGPTDHPMTEHDPLGATGAKGRVRAQMWERALAAHRDGGVRATEARASDYFGPGARAQSHIGERSIPRLLAGKPISVFGDPDTPHSWTYIADIAATLATLGSDARAWGQAWNVPTNPPMSQREIYAALARAAQAPTPRLRRVPTAVLRAGGLFVPFLREFPEIAYQFTRPFVVDSTAAQTTFGITPTPMDQALTATSAWWTDRPAAAR
jgi:nucleoside-diphosphate-sugar epimerase